MVILQKRHHDIRALIFTKSLILRNDDIKRRFRSDYIDKIRKLDDSEAEADPDFDSSDSVRDYDGVARDMKVFYTFVKGYQQFKE